MPSMFGRGSSASTRTQTSIGGPRVAIASTIMSTVASQPTGFAPFAAVRMKSAAHHPHHRHLRHRHHHLLRRRLRRRLLRPHLHLHHRRRHRPLHRHLPLRRRRRLLHLRRRLRPHRRRRLRRRLPLHLRRHLPCRPRHPTLQTQRFAVPTLDGPLCPPSVPAAGRALAVSWAFPSASTARLAVLSWDLMVSIASAAALPTRPQQDAFRR